MEEKTDDYPDSWLDMRGTLTDFGRRVVRFIQEKDAAP